MSEETLFHEALAKPASERAAFLDSACAAQPLLRAAVGALLAAHDASSSSQTGLDQTVDSEVDSARPAITGEFLTGPFAFETISTAAYYPRVE
jgi:hypothetical protein